MRYGTQIFAAVVGVALIGLIAAPAGAADCNQAGNLLTNCDFTTDLTDWLQGYGDWWSHVPGDGATAPGSVQVNSQFDGANYFASVYQDCLTLAAGVTYQAGFSARIEIGSAGATCRIRMSYYTGANCDTYIGLFYSPLQVVESTWGDIFENLDPPATTESAVIRLDCRHSSDFQVRFDDALLGQGLVPVELMSLSVE